MSEAEPVAQPKLLSSPPQDGSSLSPFGYQVFTILWTATVVSNIGTWMQSATAGWLMANLDPDPLVVALVQVAASLPMFIFALPAGALADIIDRRRLLISVQILIALLVSLFGLLVWLDRVTPQLLLVFTFLTGAAAALIAPAWQSIVPQLVPRQELQPAVALNSVGINVSRAIGPALAGLIIAEWGMAAPFWINAVTTLGVIGALIWWHPSADTGPRLPPEHFGGAIRAGLRHVRYNPHLRATAIRAASFFVFASAYWALLPLVARHQIRGGPELYGVLLGAIGVGAVGGAFLLPRLKRWLGADRLVMAGTVGTALAMALFGLARHPATALVASLVAGISWIAVLATLNVSAQLALPAWVRGRGLAVFVTVMFGALTLGSAIWGHVAVVIGLPATHMVAAFAALVSVPLLRPWKLQTGAGSDLTPSMHWPAPVIARDIEADRGPVLVSVEYQVDVEKRELFLEAITKFAHARRRDGAFQWGIFEDAAQEGRFVEAFLVDSWMEHLRQHERSTNADRELQDAVQQFQLAGTPTVRHLIAAEPAQKERGS
ncbi:MULTISPECIES: MFS transporter [unclassified Beijerinckia]|uniref:MFS transporter n=1 Tax=unclassified Beijerinckia TaxID=2638183 RepID=UPI00089CD927|nr:MULTISPECIES: MFS transporter [unclassified Beijerinckia]MDH7799050.1 MFS family permease [Beijerinckia sp. GAS462]SED96703.1 Predicted arabinose efflux permease, MFS family [Beijerinckia sp. 28-YEA-48]